MNALYVINRGFDVMGITDVVSLEPAVIGRATRVLW